MTDTPTPPCFAFNIEGNVALPYPFQLPTPSLNLSPPSVNVNGAAFIPCCKFAFNLQVIFPTLGISTAPIIAPINALILAAETELFAINAAFGLGFAIPQCNF